MTSSVKNVAPTIIDNPFAYLIIDLVDWQRLRKMRRSTLLADRPQMLWPVGRWVVKGKLEARTLGLMARIYGCEPTA